jgi:hypothetical protein
MGFGQGFSSSKGGGLQVASGSHGQVLRFHRNGTTVIGTEDFKIDYDTGVAGITGSLNLKGEFSHSGSITPESQENLGGDNNKYSQVHTDTMIATNMQTGDLHMKNERGDWTLIEERNNIILRNNVTGERFKMMMEKIED